MTLALAVCGALAAGALVVARQFRKPEAPERPTPWHFPYCSLSSKWALDGICGEYHGLSGPTLKRNPCTLEWRPWRAAKGCRCADCRWLAAKKGERVFEPAPAKWGGTLEGE